MKKLLFLGLLCMATGAQAAATTTQTQEEQLRIHGKALRVVTLTEIAKQLSIDPALLINIAENSDTERQIFMLIESANIKLDLTDLTNVTINMVRLVCEKVPSLLPELSELLKKNNIIS